MPFRQARALWPDGMSKTAEFCAYRRRVDGRRTPGLDPGADMSAVRRFEVLS